MAKKLSKLPSPWQHLGETCKIIFSNWRLFLPLLLLVVIFCLIFIGPLSELIYAGLEISGSSQTIVVFAVVAFLVLWLTTIFLLRHRLAGNQVRLRDGLYNALAPAIPTLIVALVALVQCIPLFILIIAYSAAVQTELFATPLYTLLFLAFAAGMILLSCYLLSSTLIALVAVSAPGLYPLQALGNAAELMKRRRSGFVLRLLILVVVLLVLWVVVVVPLAFLDQAIAPTDGTIGFGLVPFALIILACFSVIFVATYLYLYYRWLLDISDKKGAKK